MTIQLPSGPVLAYDLLRPLSLPPQTRLAIVAHPLGRLGGNRHDHVVQSVAALLVEHGWTTLIYDARGAGQSTGSPSFSGLPEAEDYQYMIDHVLLPFVTGNDAELLCVGYSNGCLAASKAVALIRTRHLLISYPQSVLWVLTLFRSSSFTLALEQRVETGDVLLLYGDEDQFTGVGKYRDWAGALEARGGGHLTAKELPGDHFWRSRTAKDTLLANVIHWVEP